MRTSASSSQKASPKKSNAREDGEYQGLVQQLRSASAWPLFTTEATRNGSLYDYFLDALPANRRQHYVCRACRKFIDKFGGLVTIGEGGVTSTLLWEIAPDGFFHDAVVALRDRTGTAKVTGIFLNREDTWGLAENASPKSPNASGKWYHMHVDTSAWGQHARHLLLNDEQLMAEKLQDFETLNRALADFPMELVRQAHTLLSTGSLYRSEKCIGVAKWLLDLHESLSTTKHKIRNKNLVWRAVALAPPGFCHVRSTMIGVLLTDLAEGKPFDQIKAAFDSKLSPMQYQRPQAAPTDGQLAAAEAVISKLASAGALKRRFAKLDEVIAHAIWTPRLSEETLDGSVFGHLKQSKPSSIDIPAQTMTWDKFNWTVLPTAERVELLVPSGAMPFFAFVTASDSDAPPILQWDHETARNPVSWYVYVHGSLADWWNLAAGTYCDVDAVTLQPTGWNENKADHQGDGAYFILRGARDVHYKKAGLGLFPEMLRAEYRPIRSAIEAYSQSRALEGAKAASACGLVLKKSNAAWGHVTVRVTTKGARVLYKLDRWD